ncbi:MAG: 30S ribosomal protein S15 [Helicobacter sp.]|nr:30S ribosomal protein S15 [Helicobacter sp.]
MALDLAKKKEIIAKFARSENDTGSAEVQIALLSERIAYLTQHLKINTKDHSSRLGLLKLVARRRHLLKYLKRNNYASYSSLIATLKIKDR